MPGDRRSWLRGDSLALRVIAFLSLALMPIGLIAIYQTREFQNEAIQRSELSLLALTERAASVEQQTIERAFGAAEAMGVVVDLFDDPEACSRYLERFVVQSSIYTFIGHVPPDGRMRCSSLDRQVDASGQEDFEAMMANPRPVVSLSESGLITERPVVVVAAPIFAQAGFQGYIVLSIPHERLTPVPQIEVADRTQPLGLVTFNGAGEILTMRGAAEEAALLLPEDADLADYVTFRTFAFTGRDRTGADRVFAVTPIVPGTVYAMGTWNPPRAFQTLMGSPATVGLFPVLMWMASLIVSYYAVHRLVIRHVRDLGSKMRRFATDRHVPAGSSVGEMSLELREIEEEFLQMAAGIVQDEAQLEDTVRERGILLKEVHHRVKNNLQLISSIMSMQMRRTTDPTTKSILSRLQDRILGLATIHRTLYQSDDMGRVNAAHLVREIVGQQAVGAALEGEVRVTLDLDDLELLPDQAVPLSLLTAEAVANATNNLGKPADGPAWISVVLRNRGAEGWIEIANSVAPREDEAGTGAGPGAAPVLVPGMASGAAGGGQGAAMAPRGAGRMAPLQGQPVGASASEAAQGGTRRRGLGLGMNLIHAFAAQLGGHCDIQSEGDYRISTAFAVRDLQPDPQDY